MDPGAHTVPNFLRTYNPNLVGGSLGHHLIEVSTVDNVYFTMLARPPKLM